MRHRIARLVGLLATSSVVALWLTAAPMVSAGDPCYHSFTMPTTTSEATTDIKLMPCAFTPTVTQVATGATVTFRNGGDFTHLVTGANQAWGSRDVELQPNQSVSYTFDKPGIYPYACAIHRGMSGAVVVGELASLNAGGTAAGTVGGETAGGTTAGGTAAASTTGATPTTSSPLDGSAVALFAAAAGALIAVGIVLVVMRSRRAKDEPARTQTA